MTYRLLTSAVVAATLTGCASSPKTSAVDAFPDPTEQQIASSFKEIVLERSAPQRPDWLMGDPTFEKMASSSSYQKVQMLMGIASPLALPRPRLLSNWLKQSASR